MGKITSFQSRIYRNICRFGGKLLPDKLYLELMFQARMGKKCNLEDPKSYNEKLNWLKLHDRNNKYTMLADKYAVREYIKKTIGEDYLIPMLGIWNRVEDIDINELPEQFVLKCTHDSESVIICKNKEEFDWKKAKIKLNKALKTNFYYAGREWIYKNIPPRIIAEQYMEDNRDRELRDYKFFCFNGEPKAMFIATDRMAGKTKFDYFDVNFNHLDLIQHYPNALEIPRKPERFEEMLELSKLLSKDIPHVRVDFYEINGKVYFGELTFYHFGGFMPFEPESWDMVFGDWLHLEGVKA